MGPIQASGDLALADPPETWTDRVPVGLAQAWVVAAVSAEAGADEEVVVGHRKASAERALAFSPSVRAERIPTPQSQGLAVRHLSLLEFLLKGQEREAHVDWIAVRGLAVAGGTFVWTVEANDHARERGRL
ncbi:MAG: hypothetical protein JSU70_14020 [Phycisphaerales bacterium]|nr:MAG: hypothetical protein JSU70_14020 [Phycisphaerales bacterium]